MREKTVHPSNKSKRHGQQEPQHLHAADLYPCIPSPSPKKEDSVSFNLGLDSTFSERFSVDGEGLTLGANTRDYISGIIPGRQYTKLEVVQAHQVEVLMRWHHLFVGIGFIYTICVIVLMNVKFSKIMITNKEHGWKFDLRVYDPPLAMSWFNHAASIPLFIYALALFFIFSLRILRMPYRHRTKEQVWVILLLVSMVIYLIPLRSLTKLNDFLVHPNDPSLQWRQKRWCSIALQVSDIFQVTSFTSSTIFYIWASLHSYRLFQTRIPFSFYIPKLAAVLVLVISRVAIVALYQIYPTELLLANFIAMASVYSTADFWYTPGVVYSSVSLAFEIALVSYIIWEYRETKVALQRKDYMRTRSKQIGFRFFVYHNLTFYIVFLALYISELVSLPNGLNVFVLLSPLRASYFRLHDFQFGLQLLLLAYITVEAYVNLPADAIGLMGWLNPQPPTDNISSRRLLDPITYRKREPPSLHGVVSDMRVNCFIMQTHVTMFNFAWLVYYWNTKKMENIRLTQDVFRFKIAEYIKDSATDTNVLIVDGDDRIVIVFKGTTSLKNLKTDVNTFYSNAKKLLPTELGEEDEEGDVEARAHWILNTANWKAAKVHKGFAVAYEAVGRKLLSCVKKMQDEKRRPVFLTGHSLGGALATVCSLDLFLRLGLTRREIFVSTFGAPKVGNFYFGKVYDDCVPIHWRIVVGPDLVAKLPKLGFNHVGKKVLLTVNGDLFIDPNALEMTLWNGDVASIMYHRKASYLLAMRAWCERHHGDEYLPEFWPFPVSKEDTRRFQHAMIRTSGKSSIPTMAPKKRFQRNDRVVEELGYGPQVDGNVAQKWGRLAKLALQKATPEKLALRKMPTIHVDELV